MKARSLRGLAVMILALASWSTCAAAKGAGDSPPYGTFWNGSVETGYSPEIDPDGAATCCPTYSATSESTFVSHSLNGEGVTGTSIGQSDFAAVGIDGSAALEGVIDVSGNAFALAPNNAGDGAISLGWFDTVEVVSSALPAGTPVNFRETLSLNFTDTLSSLSDASQQVEVLWIPLNDEPSVPPLSIVADKTGCDCTQSQNLTQDSLVNLVVGGKYRVIITVQLTFAGIPFANFEDGLAAISETSAFALASLSSDASFTTASGLGQPCSNTYSGTFKGNLTISSGTTCIIGGTVTGNVTQTGGTLYASAATIQRNLQISGGNFSIGSDTAINGNLKVSNVPASMVQDQVCGTNVVGNLQVQRNAAAAIVIGGPNCAADTVGGNIQVQNNAATMVISGDTAKGNLQVTDNGGMTSVTDDIAGGNIQVQNNADVTEVVDNSAAGNLQCQRNNASMVGGPNTAKQVQGQCF